MEMIFFHILLLRGYVINFLPENINHLEYGNINKNLFKRENNHK